MERRYHCVNFLGRSKLTEGVTQFEGEKEEKKKKEDVEELIHQSTRPDFKSFIKAFYPLLQLKCGRCCNYTVSAKWDHTHPLDLPPIIKGEYDLIIRGDKNFYKYLDIQVRISKRLTLGDQQEVWKSF
ncbi:hypothetical protein H6P81_005147 [Aristolochia fimbriata]|uniref:Uncharacterized protein n=1 Tax=Aristolochia fimbriata TaxID=158543 RepID=A0AAV7ETT2_ARIFI|nr:hypothetical protein H6P81_005147 [Aristolochia fimbriata]